MAWVIGMFCFVLLGFAWFNWGLRGLVGVLVVYLGFGWFKEVMNAFIELRLV